MNKPSVKQLCEAVPISKAYASNILAGKMDPARSLAIHIYREVGWRHSLIANLSEAEMAVFEQHDPWVPPSERAA